MSSQSLIEQLLEHLEFIAEHDSPSPDESDGNLLVQKIGEDDKTLARYHGEKPTFAYEGSTYAYQAPTAYAYEAPNDAYTGNLLKYRAELKVRRTKAMALLDVPDVKRAITSMDDWELRSQKLKWSLTHYDYKFGREIKYWSEIHISHTIRESVKDHESGVIFIREFGVELKQLISDPVRRTLKGTIAISLYDDLISNGRSEKSFNSLYDCWPDTPPIDSTLVAALKRLRIHLLSHKLTVTISESNCTAKLEKKLRKGT